MNVHGTLHAGAVVAPSAEARLEFDDPAQALAAARDFGIQTPLDFSGHAHAHLEFRNEVGGDNTSTGELRAVGVNSPGVQCVSSAAGTTCSSPSGETDLFALGWVSRRH